MRRKKSKLSQCLRNSDALFPKSLIIIRLRHASNSNSKWCCREVTRNFLTPRFSATCTTETKATAIKSSKLSTCRSEHQIFSGSLFPWILSHPHDISQILMIKDVTKAAADERLSQVDCSYYLHAILYYIVYSVTRDALKYMFH